MTAAFHKGLFGLLELHDLPQQQEIWQGRGMQQMYFVSDLCSDFHDCVGRSTCEYFGHWGEISLELQSGKGHQQS